MKSKDYKFIVIKNSNIIKTAKEYGTEGIIKQLRKGDREKMLHWKMKKVLSLMLASVMTFSTAAVAAPVAVAAETGQEKEKNNGRVLVEVANASGTMDLTKEGTVDWMHITSEQINRKALPEEEEPTAEIIDFMNVSAASGRTFGQVKDQVMRYQTFTPKVSGILSDVQVALIKKGSPSALIAGLYKMGDTPELLAGTTIPADQITSNTALTLGFGEDIHLEAGVTYAVALTQETTSQDDNYWWCNAQTSLPSGKINENNAWIAENTPASLRVVIGDENAVAEKKAVDIIQFETLGEMKLASSFSDSAVAYSWSGGMPTETSTGLKKGGVLSYRNGEYSGPVEEEAGWKISIPAADAIQTLSFVSGIWQASSAIWIYADGDLENPIYTNTELTAGGSSKLLKYAVTVAPGTSIEIYGKLTNKANVWGNTSMSGITLSRSEADDGTDYIDLLQETVITAEAWLNEEIDAYFINQLTEALDSAKAVLENEGLTNEEAYSEYIFLSAAITAVETSQTTGSFANAYASGLTASFGWEGDKDAPIAWVDGTYRLRDNGNKVITFGVTGLPSKSINWYNAEGYLPCFVSEYSKNGMDYKIENFADLVVIDGKKYEVAYSRMTVANNNDEVKLLPRVSSDLIPLNDAAKNVRQVQAGETVVREYCIGADRFGGSYAYPEDAVLAAQGNFDEHYNHMKDYWNTRLEKVIDIQSVPEKYTELINAYKAGYIYMLIISDGYELHVGENGYDRVFDHDVIGMLASLIESGHTEHFADYAQYILMNIQYPDAAWKFSWPFALYLQKTGDFDTVLSFFEDNGGHAGIKTNTHKIASEREVYNENILDEDGNPARIMKRTDAIDSYGYWGIDNWASLFGLTTYSYICDQFYAKTGDESYKAEYDWAKAEYDSLRKSVEAVLADTMEKYDFDYIPISMVVPNELSARSDVRDGNWAAHYLFGRWDWDGYLFGADQDSWLLDMTDQTYDFITEQKSTVFDSPYNMGGYPHGYFSSAYNAGYFSGALSGEKWRDGGIEAYLWMINNSMGGLYGWWEGVAYPNDNTVWDRESSFGGGGSCQHMWGQSTATKVLIDSFFAEKADGSIIAGRGLPLEFNADGEEIKISNYLCGGGKRIGFHMNTNDKTVTFELTGDELENTVSLELLAFVDNIESVSEGCTFDAARGSVQIPAGIKKVTITLQENTAGLMEHDQALAELNTALTEAAREDLDLYVASTAGALTDAIAAGKALTEKGTTQELLDAAAAIRSAVEGLVERKTYDVAFDYFTGVNQTAQPTFGQKSDQRYRYATFKTGSEDVDFDKLEVKLRKYSGPFGDCLISIYTLEEDNFTLDTCLGTARLAADSVKDGDNTFTFEPGIHLDGDTYYAIFFAMDNTDDTYGSYWYYAGPFMSDDLYACKINGAGEVINENAYGLGTPLMKMYSVRTDKTALERAVENALPGDALEAAKQVLLKRDATQEEIDKALERLTKAPLAFVDVDENDWFYGDVEYVSERGIMTGLKETRFGPETELSRAQFVTILYRMAGSPEISYEDKFPDVKDGEFYTSAVMWASENKIVTGYVDTGLYAPDKSISREELSVMMRRYAAYSGQDVTADGDLSFYADEGSVSEFAREGMSWAVANRIIQGADGQLLKPQDQANRAECAAIIHRYLEKAEK